LKQQVAELLRLWCFSLRLAFADALAKGLWREPVHTGTFAAFTAESCRNHTFWHKINTCNFIATKHGRFKISSMTQQASPQLDIYVNYPGHCEAAFRFYEQQIGGRLMSMMRHAEMPSNPNIPENWKNAVLHARMEIGNTVLMGADIPHAEPMRSTYLTLRFDTEAEAERVYRVLSEDGEVFMKMEETFYATRFAMLRDKFGTSWMLLREK
jgi:PhnB protein